MSEHKSEIKINVRLDEEKVPDQIMWHSSDNPNAESPQECKAFFLSLFDKEHKDTLRIDLWTKEMQVAEMDRFLYFTLKGLSESYYRATNNNDLANHLRRFTDFFGEESGIVPKEGNETDVK